MAQRLLVAAPIMRLAPLLSLLLPLAAACGGSTTNSDAPREEDSGGMGGTTNNEPPSSSSVNPANVKTWCTTAGEHDFCADFDGLSPLGNWDKVVQGNDYRQKDQDDLVRSDRSSPNALRLSGEQMVEPYGGPSTGQWAGTFFMKALPTTTSTKAKVSFDLYVAKVGGQTGVIELVGRAETNGHAFSSLSFAIAEEASWLYAASAVPTRLRAIDQERWVRVEIAIDDNGGTGGAVALAYDGESVGTTSLEGSLASSVATTLYLGISRTYPSDAYDVRYDNLTVDLR